MPLYEYRCTSCGERLEALQHLADAPLRECPRCGGVLEKLISAPALQFKGTGWYVTDYGHRHSTAASASDGGAKESSAKAESTPTEKPAKPADPAAKAS